MRVRHALLGLFLVSLCGCLGQTPPARAQEAATELNTNGRFGRTELVAERIADASRDKFFERRKSWGGKIQIADSEIMNLKMLKGDSQAEVMLKVGWYKVDEDDLKVTTLKQSWKDFKGTWKLVAEDRAEGDYGLLGEAPEPHEKNAATASPKKRTQFATIRLGQGDESTAEQAPTDTEVAPAESPSDGPASAPNAPSAATLATPAVAPAPTPAAPSKP